MLGNPGSYSTEFKWTIHPPYLSGETREAMFHRQSLSVAKWRVQIRFAEERIGYWYFALTLSFIDDLAKRPTVRAQEIFARIILGGKEILWRKVPGYTFHRHNQPHFFAHTWALMFAQMESVETIVKIGITLEEDVFSQADLIRLNKFRNDVLTLGDDMLRLARDPLFPNVHLYSSAGELFYAHSYVLKVRWDRLFELHSFGTTANTVVRTNISSPVLRDILTYMYSGSVQVGWPEWTNPFYITELLQVLRHYNIQHLSDVLEKSDSSQTRESRKSAFIRCYDFRLDFVNDGPVTDGTDSLHSQENTIMLGTPFTQDHFVLHVHVRNWNRAGAWLSYSIHSRYDGWAHVQVNVELLKMISDGMNQRAVARKTPVHTSSYIIDRHESKESGPVLFLGCLEAFDGFRTLSASGSIEQWFRFNVSFTDDTSLDQYISFDGNQDRRMVQYNVLSDHMSDLMKREIHADVRLESRPRNPIEVRSFRFLHRAILRTRVPRLRDVMTIFGPGQGLPEVSIIDLSGDALEYVVDYIYSGKIFIIPQHLLAEISDFADRADLQPLKILVDSRREDYINAEHRPRISN